MGTPLHGCAQNFQSSTGLQNQILSNNEKLWPGLNRRVVDNLHYTG